MNGQTVNVKRVDLLAALKENLEIHQREYQEAVFEYRRKLYKDLTKAAEMVGLEGKLMLSDEELKNIRVQFSFPPNYEQSYLDVIEMLEMSIDETINLDSQHFKMYIKNQWSWMGGFQALKMSYSA
ncbi:MAG TPA: hypothetical protein VN922_21105 [Bacteroidia bacterium]|nr:hypothetical protein [Bacteroidia bacterium]